MKVRTAHCLGRLCACALLFHSSSVLAQEAPQPPASTEGDSSSASDTALAGELTAKETPPFDWRRATVANPPGFVDTRVGSVVITPREPDQPVAGYEPSPVNGFFVQSTDGQFRLQIGAYTQIRWNGNWRSAPDEVDGEPDGQNFTRGFSLNRTRIFFEGAFTDRVAYHFRLNINASFDFELLNAWAQIKLGKRWNARFGKLFIPLSREDWMFAQDLLTTEYSPNDFTFAIGTSLGGFVQYAGEEHRLWISLHNGSFGGVEVFPPPESPDIATTVRWEWQASGTDWSIWDDMVGRRGRAQGILLGVSGAFQARPGSDATGNRMGGQANFDLSFNGDGYQAVLAGSATILRPIGGDPYALYGLLAQVGYFVISPLQIYTQYNFLSPGSAPGDLDNFNSLAVGLNYFPFLWTNRWKFSLEGGLLFNALSRTIVAPSGALDLFASNEAPQGYVRVQAQFGF